MIINFVRDNELINTDNMVRMYTGLTGGGPNSPDRHYVAFKFTTNEYKHVFWKVEDYNVAMSKIRDAFKKHKRYIEIDG